MITCISDYTDPPTNSSVFSIHGSKTAQAITSAGVASPWKEPF